MKRIASFILPIMIGLSCSTSSNFVQSENLDILKKVTSDFIVENREGMDKIIGADSINNMIIYIQRKAYLMPDSSLNHPEYKITFSEFEIYTYYYANNYTDEGLNTPPSALFYVDGYPIMLYDDRAPPIKRKRVPQYLRKNDKVWIGGGEWTVAICKKNHKYIVIKDSYLKGGNETIDAINAFSCES